MGDNQRHDADIVTIQSVVIFELQGKVFRSKNNANSSDNFSALRVVVWYFLFYSVQTRLNAA